MRHFHIRAALVAIVALAGLSACGSSSKSNASPNTNAPATTAAGASATTDTTASAASSGTATVSLAKVTNEKVGGKEVLVDSKGMTLYVWDKDKTAGHADCTGACADAWPPLYVTGTATYGTGLSAAMFSTVKGPNGNAMLAVNGKPLYAWKADTKPGDATGQGVNGFYVVGANGKKIDTD